MSCLGEMCGICSARDRLILSQQLFNGFHTLVGYVKCNNIVMLCKRGNKLDANISNADHSNQWGFRLSYRKGALRSNAIYVGFADVFRRWSISGQRAADGAPDVLDMLELQSWSRVPSRGTLEMAAQHFRQLTTRGAIAKALSMAAVWCSSGVRGSLLREKAQREGHG